ncbi:MAG: glycosyltransferase [Pseudomonas sp.]
MNAVRVLLASWNGGQWLQPQVESILAQQGVNIRLLIGDDCSKDGSAECVTTALNDDRIEVVTFSEPSGGAGQNFIRTLVGAELTDVDYVAFADQDDIWHADKMLRAVSALKISTACGYSSSVIAFWPDGKEKILEQNPVTTDLDFLFEGAGQGCTFVLAGPFARQVQQLLRNRAVDISNVHYHDWLIYAISRSLGKQWFFDAQPSMRYRQHDGNDTGARGALAGVKKRLGLIRNGWYAKQVQHMLFVSRALNPTVIPADFLAAWERERGFKRRIKLGSILFKRGRRRSSDRLVLTLAAAMGWI